jgi:hypothetical protein
MVAMIVRLGNTAPVYVKAHDASCIPECPARHQVVVSWTEETDAEGNITQTPVYESVHDGTKERVVVVLGPTETYRVTTSDINVEDTDEEKVLWLDRAFKSIVDDNGAWAQVSDAPPLWVESDWSELQQRLAAWYNCSIGEPIAEEATP